MPAPLGPAPAYAAPVLAPARRRVAQALRDLGPDATLAALSDRLGGHPNATRAHLRRLVDDGHATVHLLPRTDPGRPAQGWTLSAAGERALAPSAPAAAYAELVVALAEGLDTGDDPAARARRLGRIQGTRRDRDPGQAAGDAAVTLMDELGFDPDRHGRRIRLRRCPLLDAARRARDVVCSAHEGLLQGALGDERVRLIPFAEPGACVVALP